MSALDEPSKLASSQRSKPNAIYINPNFNGNLNQLPNIANHNPTAINILTAMKERPKTHINPLFLQGLRAPAIHMNPLFLHRMPEQQFNNAPVNHQEICVQRQQQQQQQQPQQQQPLEKLMHPIANVKTLVEKSNHSHVMRNHSRIITKSRMKIVREPLQAPRAPKVDQTSVSSPPQGQLIRINSRKLVRCGAATKTLPQVDTKKENKTPPGIITKNPGKIKYKLDRRVPSVQQLPHARATRVSKPVSNKFAVKKSIRSTSGNLKLELLNINGVLYKSSRNKLERKDGGNAAAIAPTVATANTANTAQPSIGLFRKRSSGPRAIASSGVVRQINVNRKNVIRGRSIIVRGSKFVMDMNGFKLTRLPTSASASDSPTATATASSTSPSSIPARISASTANQRIYIGGLTYVASGKRANEFECSRHHLALAHVNSAKQRSMFTLRRNLVKSNVPCAIYKRVGRCIAHERGRCYKVHDRRQVAICPKFLRGDCTNGDKCLLSHDVSLSKMPVCKFYLEAFCDRDNCPYLHKKLSGKAEICEDFLRGFCLSAEKCPKRHEFLCVKYEREGKCSSVSCVYCKARKRREEKDKRSRGMAKRVVAAQPASVENPNTPTDCRRKSTPAVKRQKRAAKVLGEKISPTEEKTPSPPMPNVVRYFVDNQSPATEGSPATGKPPAECDEGAPTNTADSDTDTDSGDDIDNAPTTYLPKRPKLGVLPAFIPIE